MKNKKKPELMAPAGDWSCIYSAKDAGADAIYFGIDDFNMRAAIKNFKISELKKIAKFCHENCMKAYLTVNIIIYEKELKKLEKILSSAKKAGIDAIICWDLSVIELCKKHKLPFVVSTQASISNSAAAQFYKDIGASRVVLARECSLDDIKEIRKKVDLEIEVFVHGAMCVSVSGRCYTSQFLFGKSANRGECLQPCRREYTIKDAEEGHELLIDNNYVMSAKDLCAMPFIDKVLDAGVDSLKIEGRTKGADYVKVVTQSYRRAIDAWAEGNLTKELKDELYNNLSNVYTRGFSAGFFFGTPDKDDFATQHGSVSKRVKLYSGKVINYYKKVEVANILIENTPVDVGDEILIIGPTTGCVIGTVDKMETDGKSVYNAKKGMNVGIKVDGTVRKNDKVYVRKKEK